MWVFLCRCACVGVFVYVGLGVFVCAFMCVGVFTDVLAQPHGMTFLLIRILS